MALRKHHPLIWVIHELCKLALGGHHLLIEMIDEVCKLALREYNLLIGVIHELCKLALMGTPPINWNDSWTLWEYHLLGVQLGAQKTLI